jgi:hypothetical protein
VSAPQLVRSGPQEVRHAVHAVQLLPASLEPAAGGALITRRKVCEGLLYRRTVRDKHGL